MTLQNHEGLDECRAEFEKWADDNLPQNTRTGTYYCTEENDPFETWQAAWSHRKATPQPLRPHEAECFDESLRAKKIYSGDKKPISADTKDINILSDPFHACALRAFAEVMQETGQFPPDSETTRKRAYKYYEGRNG